MEVICRTCGRDISRDSRHACPGAGEVTCVWTSAMARRMYEQYKTHLEILLADAERARPMSASLEDELSALTKTIHTQMAELVQKFAMPAYLMKR